MKTNYIYQSVNSSTKFQLLLQRSFRYSYRQRFCSICPTILCEFFFSFLLIFLLLFIRDASNALIRDFANQTNIFNGTHCSQQLEQISEKSNRCLKFSSMNIVFQPKNDEIDRLVELAKTKFNEFDCDRIGITSETLSEERQNELLRNLTMIIDFRTIENLRNERQLKYQILVRMSNRWMKNDPIDDSFLSYLHPSFIADRSKIDLYPLTDLKIFIDNLLIHYQTNRSIDYQLTRRSLTCTSFRRDLLFESGIFLVITILISIDFVFLIPFLILIVNLIREKNAQVKQILKALGISSIFNNVAHAIRTLIIATILTLILSLALKFNLNPDAFFNRIHFTSVFLAYFIFNLQLISLGIFTGQIYDRIIRSMLGTWTFYFVSLILHPNILNWPTEIQYILIFISPFIGGYSLFQQMVLHELASTDLMYFQPIYRHVPMFGPTLIVMFISCLFYWFCSWYIEFGISFRWNFRFKTNQRHAPFGQLSSLSLDPSTIVRIDHLTKQFGPDQIAVNDVSFDLYENQITSLLGPNGSGKTTIFNCLIGIDPPTSGRIFIVDDNGDEYDTRFHSDLIRKSIGYCPQHDILFDLFTVKEQVEFYAIARGYRINREEIAEEILRLVNLQSSKNLFCQSLSGGMKRRLSLACAFVGQTKIVLLDEPSSGLDPSNRRALWDWLRTMKQGKTLLLTTHFMEESDALSDRILIISNGIIQADGTPTQLKQEFGSGYKFIVHKYSSTPSEEIQSTLRRFIPEISIESETINGDVVFRTNQQPNERFIQSLKELQRMKENQQIKHFGVQNSTLDDVFAAMTRGKTSSSSNSIDSHRIERQCRRIFDQQQFFIGFRFYLNQFYGLLIKTLRVRYRRWALTSIVVLLPIIYHLLSNIIYRTRNDIDVFSPNINSLNPQTIVYRSNSTIEKYFPSNKNLRFDRQSMNISEMNRYIFNQRLKRPFTYTDIYFALDFSQIDENRHQIESLTSNLISGYEVISFASNIFYKHVMNDPQASIETKLIHKNIGNWTIQPTLGDLWNLLSSASCALKFLPVSLLLDVFIFYLFFFYTTVFLINERKDKFLSLLNISGLHPMSYWTFNYLFDLFVSVIWFCYLLIVFCLIEISFNGYPKNSIWSIFQFDNPWDLRLQFYPLTILIVLPSLPLAYLLTKFFHNDILGGLAIVFIFILIHMISIIIPIVNMIVRSSSTRSLLYWLFNILFPSINSQVLITYLLARQSRFCQLANLFFDATDFHPLGDDTIKWNIVILVVHILFFLGIVILIDCGIFRWSFSCFYRSKFDEKLLDEDVRTERNRLIDENDHLIVKDLVKYYPWKRILALDHLTFGARRGEVFGLLGFNGAGKTTTFRILVRDLIATYGQVKINARRPSLGYCPQENCSMDFLTVEESLYLFARIRGVRSSRIHSFISTISSLFLLEPFRHNYIHQLSGGTKRRLHAVLALIGPPTIAILDEPTTGVDPNARLQMQEIFLNAVQNGLTLILTSHSMDECERVCHRLGIMVRGQFACLGTIQHLKSKFGQGYSIEIKVRLSSDDFDGKTIDQVRTFLIEQNQFEIETKEITHSTGLFQSHRGDPADLFQLLENHKQRLNIETYTISQTTLEQIFLSVGQINEHCTSICL